MGVSPLDPEARRRNEILQGLLAAAPVLLVGLSRVLDPRSRPPRAGAVAPELSPELLDDIVIDEVGVWEEQFAEELASAGSIVLRDRPEGMLADALEAQGLTPAVLAYLVGRALDEGDRDRVARGLMALYGRARANLRAEAAPVVGAGGCFEAHDKEGEPALRPVFRDGSFRWECMENPAHYVVMYRGTLGCGSTEPDGQWMR